MFLFYNKNNPCRYVIKELVHASVELWMVSALETRDVLGSAKS